MSRYYGFDYGDSAEGYMQQRRRRKYEAGARGLEGYAAYLAGFGDGVDPVMSSVIGAEVAAEDSNAGDAASRAILIGVTTGVLTFLLNRWLGKVLG